jgi:hypothetical protein
LVLLVFFKYFAPTGLEEDPFGLLKPQKVLQVASSFLSATILTTIGVFFFCGFKHQYFAPTGLWFRGTFVLSILRPYGALAFGGVYCSIDISPRWGSGVWVVVLQLCNPSGVN